MMLNLMHKLNVFYFAENSIFVLLAFSSVEAKKLRWVEILTTLTKTALLVLCDYDPANAMSYL